MGNSAFSIANGGGGGAVVEIWELLDTQTAAASASLDFTTDITSTHISYRFEVDRLVAASSSTLYSRVSIDGGATWVTAFNAYFHTQTFNTNGTISSTAGLSGAGAATQQWQLSSAVSVTAGHGVSGTYTLYGPSTGTGTNIVGSCSQRVPTTAGQVEAWCSGVFNGSSSPVDAIQFLMQSGNIASGTIRMYGLLAANP